MDASVFPDLSGMTYLNGAYMSPLPAVVEEAGIRAISGKRNPISITPDRFFEGPEEAKKLFGALVNAPAEQVAIVPSVSYGLANAVQNLPLEGKDHVLIVGEEFPSDYYAFHRLYPDHGISLIPVTAPSTGDGRGESWNNALITAIRPGTAAVVLSMVHWADGTLFKLEEISKACKANKASLIVDGTQSVGAIPVDVANMGIDVLVCAGYKWLLGPYAIGFAYYSEAFNEGKPIEESWMNRMGSDDFANLTRYADEYRPGAARYNMGESSNFILMAMMIEALKLVHELKPARIQAHCRKLAEGFKEEWEAMGFWVENEKWRAGHLFGLGLPPELDKSALMVYLREKQIYTSLRGNFLRISPHIYNTRKDLEALSEALREFSGYHTK